MSGGNEEEEEVPNQDVVDKMKVRETLVDGSVTTALKTTVMGIAFGFILNKSRVIEPHKIADQFAFKQWAMLKLFLAATGSSAITLAITKIVSKDKWLITRKKSEGSGHLFPNIVGGMMLGAGMAIAGGCPGLIYSQIGAGVPNSLYSYIGGAFGAFTYGLLIDPLINKYSLFQEIHIKPKFLDQLLGIDFSKVAFGFGSLLFGAAYYLDKLFPYKNELIKPNPSNCNLITCPSWSPLLAGAFLGLLQLPTTLVLGNTVGGSSSYANVSGQWLRLTKEKTRNYYSHFNAQLNRWWQPVFLISAISGSALAVYAAGGNVKELYKEPYDGIEGLSPVRHFAGGFVMIFASRLAKGCASGHGLSGMGLLSNASFIAVVSMFTGGILAAKLINK